jgi:glucose/arabinose dehydrogenase
MKNLHTLHHFAAAAIFAMSLPVVAAIQLSPVVTVGITTPTFVVHAGDVSNRLFIVQQNGIVLVLHPSASLSSQFLDIRSKVLAGGERGLLGLAFHPQYASNGRFFVYYTRAGDGAIVIAEYGVSGNPDVANVAEKILLTIPHPTNANHNGGMIAFGGDGYLYIGVGDGGSANDPPNNAQNINALLGKILRIDVDRSDPAAGTPYAAPLDNPYVGIDGRDEIYSIGWRNPWRFSFDRLTKQQWVADVGQGTREEVDTPVVKGANYGWRTYEGTACTNNNPGQCDAIRFIPPVFEYLHTAGRCSITGGYVYRGTRNTVFPGTYIYGDYCTGEIFGWDGSTQTLLLDTNLAISSFGEDEEGELYVVDLNGAIWKIDGVGNTIARVIEYYHPAFNHYFITANRDEIAMLDNATFSGWVRTGLYFNVYSSSVTATVPVCRFFSTAFAPKSSHFYTSDARECSIVKSNPDWQFEGEVFNIALPAFDTDECPFGSLQIFRLYNNGDGGAPNHRYTTEGFIRDSMLDQGWIPEGAGVGVIGCAPL